MGTPVLSRSPLHTRGMRRQIQAILQSDDPGITPAVRAAAMSALTDPASLSNSAILVLSEALTRAAGRLGGAPKDGEVGSSSS